MPPLPSQCPVALRRKRRPPYEVPEGTRLHGDGVVLGGVVGVSVTSTVISLSPTASSMAPLGEPLVTVVSVVPALPTFTVEPATATVGVSLT